MSIPGKVLVALFAALLASVITPMIVPTLSLSILFIPTASAAVAAVILSHRALPMPSGLADTTPAEPQSREQKARKKERKSDNKRAAGDRKKQERNTDKSPQETGQVKWFNGTKGFGFIVRESGEEIFVHHRSIKGDGRRGLKDGAAVRFRVVTTDKGPQAEDVESVA